RVCNGLGNALLREKAHAYLLTDAGIDVVAQHLQGYRSQRVFVTREVDLRKGAFAHALNEPVAADATRARSGHFIKRWLALRHGVSSVSPLPPHTQNSRAPERVG